MSTVLRPVTPTIGPARPYVLPHTFRIVGQGIGSLTQLSRSNDVHALRAAIRVAMRILKSPAALRTTNAALATLEDLQEPHLPLPPPLSPNTTPIDPEILQWQTEFLRTGPFEVVIDHDIQAYGCVNKKSEPHIIHIRANLVYAAGDAYEFRHLIPVTYDAHILFLANTLIHEVQHAMRGQLETSRFWTPPKINDRRHSRVLTIDDKSENRVALRKGEGGFYLEDQVMGGTMRATLVDIASQLSLFENLIEDLFITRWVSGTLSYTFRISDRPHWENLLPLHPQAGTGTYGDEISGREFRHAALPTSYTRKTDKNIIVSAPGSKQHEIPSSISMSRESTLSSSEDSDLEVETIPFIQDPTITIDRMMEQLQNWKLKPMIIPPDIEMSFHEDLEEDEGMRCGTEKDEVVKGGNLSWTTQQWREHFAAQRERERKK